MILLILFYFLLCVPIIIFIEHPRTKHNFSYELVVGGCSLRSLPTAIRPLKGLVGKIVDFYQLLAPSEIK